MWFQVAVHANVFREKFFWSTEAKLGIDSPNLTNSSSVFDNFPCFPQPLAVHEHNSIHKLNSRFFAAIYNFLNLFKIYTTWFFAQ